MNRAVVMLAAVVAFAAPEAQAAVDLTEEDFRLYCGYLDALEQPDIAKLKDDKAREAKIAKMAKVKPAQVSTALEKGRVAGATCDEIGKRAAKDAKAALDKALPGRITFFELDTSDPSHVVALVSWLGIDKKKLVEESCGIAAALAETAPLTKTIAVRGVDPTAVDPKADTAAWFEAKITGANAKRIDKGRIWEYATTRYRKLFDGVVER
ncbi:MAG: hypothetical protein FJ137_11270 [Deltaproteobacteria bacterium]|nr:hypothetical protein [Deltaproteobacteria bacterium]